jgi:hypothetical protein
VVARAAPPLKIAEECTKMHNDAQFGFAFASHHTAVSAWPAGTMPPG